MEKSYNDIKAQEQRVMALCLERGRWCDNAKKRLDTQHLAQITRHTLTQHGFPLFGQYDKDEKHACVHHEPEHKPEPVKEQEPEPKPVKVVRPTPTEQQRCGCLAILSRRAVSLRVNSSRLKYLLSFI